ncbi:MAG TPA: hypothetical protein VGH98_10690 [Gemmatimonadaceae bacterium]|jgi:hypothetical protein
MQDRDREFREWHKKQGERVEVQIHAPAEDTAEQRADGGTPPSKAVSAMATRAGANTPRRNTGPPRTSPVGIADGTCAAPVQITNVHSAHVLAKVRIRNFPIARMASSNVTDYRTACGRATPTGAGVDG